jgi:cysteine-rich repeat protein
MRIRSDVSLSAIVTLAVGCSSLGVSESETSTITDTSGTDSGDGDGDPDPGDGDGDPGDGDPGDGDPGDGDPGDGDPGDGDGDPGDGDPGFECGDMRVQAGEDCDDGNEVDTDACTNACTAAACGDAIVQDGVEACDAGPDNGPGSACKADCTLNVCGDSDVGPGESCDDGNLLDDDGCAAECVLEAPPNAATMLELGLAQVKQFEFTWAAALGAEYYQLFESVDGQLPFVQVGGDVVDLATSLTVPLHARVNASYVVRACNEYGCTDSEPLNVSGTLEDAIGYFKSSNSGPGDRFGNNVALSEDGNTLAVSAILEDSNATGIDGNQADDSAVGSGAVYVFTRNGIVWTQQAYVKASNTDADDTFGTSLALSDDGRTLAVGARKEASSASGINGDQSDNSLDTVGAVYVYTRDGMDVWTQDAYIKASNPESHDWFGYNLALSGDGDTLAVGAPYEASNAAGINGNQADNSLLQAGAVYVFERDGMNVWAQQSYIKSSNPDAEDRFGWDLALSQDGSTLIVGAPGEDSNATGIDGNQADNSRYRAGAVYVFERDGLEWTQQAYVKASNTDGGDVFGSAVALSDDGNTLIVAAPEEDSSAAGINGGQDIDNHTEAGAVYVFERDEMNVWAQQAYVKASNPGEGDLFGYSVALSGDGNTLAVGAGYEGSNAVGIGGDQLNNDNLTGASYVFVRDGMNGWTQQAYVKASNTGVYERFGNSVALSEDGSTLCVSSHEEDSDAIGIGGNQGNNGAEASGAVYLY